MQASGESLYNRRYGTRVASREEDAVAEALALWEERERRRLEILAMVDEADASFARGEGILLTEESVKELVEEAKQRLLRRIEAERSATSRRWRTAFHYEPESTSTRSLLRMLESGSLQTADRLLESIYRRFLVLGEHPHAGRRRDDLRPGLRVFPSGQYLVL